MPDTEGMTKWYIISGVAVVVIALLLTVGRSITSVNEGSAETVPTPTPEVTATLQPTATPATNADVAVRKRLDGIYAKAFNLDPSDEPAQTELIAEYNGVKQYANPNGLTIDFCYEAKESYNARAFLLSKQQ